MDTDTRKELEEICKKPEWHNPDKFQSVSELLPEEIKVIESPPGEKWQFNCYAYALGLHELSDFYMTSQDGFIYSLFVKKLLSKGELRKVIDRSPRFGDIILYKDNGELTHAGVVAEGEGKIISKWSSGPILKHNVLLLPISCGYDVSYYNPLSKAVAEDLFHCYRQFNIQPD